MSFIETIVSVANSYVGQREKPGNLGFIDNSFEQKMKSIGWFSGAAWCAYFGKLIYKEAIEQLSINDSENILRLFSPMAVVTFRNFEKAGYLCDKNPCKGSIVVWQKGATQFGHLGIVTMVVNKKSWVSVEGNTNAAGSRDGEVVAAKSRTSTGTGSLKLLGFVHVF